MCTLTISCSSHNALNTPRLSANCYTQ
jgi:hypothetical protein